MKSRSFDIALNKGAIGEEVVRLLLEKRGWVVYQPITTGPHHFDMLSIKDKASAIALDVKAKARMNKFRATGVNQKHFEEYKRFSAKHKMPFWIVFVDEHPGERRIYGNTLEELEKPYFSVDENITYPWVMNGRVPIRLWSLEVMKEISPLDEDVCQKLITVSQRSYEYETRKPAGGYQPSQRAIAT